MMKKLRTSLVTLIMMAVSSVIMADLINEANPERFEEATEGTAKQFVSGYYSHLKRGMSRIHLATYYTETMMEKYDAAIRRVGEKTKGDLTLEAQRFLDLDMMNARCEKLTNVDVKVYGLNFRKAKLRYRVTPQCSSSKPESQRVISLSYKTGEKSWVIIKREEEAN